MTLVCPSCGREHADEERFCRSCGLPLVPEGGPAEAQVDERGARARKIKPQYSEGELVRVKVARQQPEAEFIQSLLLEEGIPSTLRRTRGFDVPEMLAAGPRDVLVPASGFAAAREVLLEAELIDDAAPAQTDPRRLLVGLLAGVAVVAVLVVLIDALG
ncbi:MAG TPA: zinc-ribbon domain-containing protein [Solirubrobacteraceae bacterium]|nr:zinc-ribbon domain-containing protein [Solirubrobacteraceae bacterium]